MCKTYRQAVKLAWDKRPNSKEEMTNAELAREIRRPAQHISDYLAKDDKPKRRNLPADAVAEFERVVENTLVSQWLAAQSKLTVLEEMQATRAVA
jgi:hypothetical protein